MTKPQGFILTPGPPLADQAERITALIDRYDALAAPWGEHPLRQWLVAGAAMAAHTAETNGSHAAGWKYRGQAEFLVCHGRPFTISPNPRGLRRGPLGECYRNVANKVLKDPCRYRYVEGLAAGLLPVSHAWLLDTETGRAHELTWAPGDGTAYIGVVFRTDYLLRLAEETGAWAILENWHNDFALFRGEHAASEAIDPWPHAALGSPAP